MTGAALILQGDALHLPLPDASVDLIVTSPPFWNLRDYGVPGQIGNEASRQDFLEQLWEATRECMRVMKSTASLFVELGDSYSDKSLNLTPQRYALGCIDTLGLMLRAEIIWNRPNGLPESVTDRVRLSHSRWWHLVKQPRYYSATDEVREAYESKPQRRFSPMIQGKPRGAPDGTPPQSGYAPVWDEPKAGDNPLGKLPGSVWSVPSEPLRLPEHLGVQHYAAFPSEWPRRLILGWSPPGICLECGQGRVPVVERETVPDNQGCIGMPKTGHSVQASPLADFKYEHDIKTARVLGYGCLCSPQQRQEDGTLRTVPFGSEGLGDGPPTRPAVVLDPFSGTGTTTMVARALGRIGVGVDLSHAYCRAARWRVRHDGAKAISRTNLERQGSLL